RGIFNVAAFETPTKTYRSGLSGVHRFNPRTFETEFHYPIGPNPHGDVFDRWGFQFANDGTSGTGGYVSIGKGQRPGNRQWFKKEWRPVAATGILSSEHFPDRFQNNFLICNTIGFLGVLRYEVKYDGAQIIAERTEDLIQSSDPNFRPSDIEVGGDGAIYISDWHNTLIGHMQHNMRDPNRDHLHGRIYRVTAVGSAPARPVKMVDQPVEEVLSHFFSKTNSVRYRARLELSGRDSGETIEAVTRFAAGLNPARVESDRDEAQALLECLWVHEEHRVPNVPLVKKTYQVAEPRVRAAAIRTLGHWAEHNVPEWEPILAMAAQDQSPLVRAEAVKAAVNFAGLAATEVIFEVATRDTDDELNDVLEFARNQIDVDKMIAESIAAQRPLSPAAKRYALSNADAELLLKMERSPEVFQALVARANIEPEIRWQAIDHVFQGAGQQRVQRILAAIQTAERSHFDSFNELASLLSTLDTSELENAGSVLKQLVESTQSADARQAAYAAWFRAGQSQAAQAWAHAITSRVLLNDALVGIESIGDKNSLASVFDRVRPLMFELPQHLQTTQDQAESAGGPAVSFEYYEPNPRNVAVETLDKIKPQLIGSIDNFNVYVPKGRHDEFATRQTAYLLVPEGGRYSFYTNSDDGSRLYIDGRLVVDNDGDHGMVEKSGRIRLDAGQHKIVVTYCDSGGGDGLVVSWRGPGIEKQPIPTSALRSTGGGNLRQRALEVIARWPGHTQEKIRDFAALTTDDSLAISALEALANQPVASVASQIQGDNSRRLLASIVARADLATPVEKQEDVYSRMLTLGESLLASDAGDNSLARKLRDLRASIPVKADPRVMSLGAEVYARESHCATCHQPHGQGLPNLYPPLDGSLWATGSQERLIHLVLDGMHGTIEVKGKRYSSPPLPPMTGFRHLLNDEEIAAVVTYVRNSWTNRAAPIDAAAVASVRATNRDGDAVFWGANELLKLYPLEDGSQPIDQGPSDGWIPKLVKEWQVKDFSPADLAISGRSHADGALWFNRIGCAQCHTLGGKGGVFGPNLAELEPKKQSAAAILESILDPSKDIDPKFAMKNYLLESGNVISGFVVMETPTEIHLKSDPLSPDKSVIVSKDEIEEASTSTKSVMPQGLLNWLTKQQILDLLAYVHSGGDENHSVYQE
ncbi:MAG: c-type cytochrome, partial [Planctomycetales bacterium]|nr:c-type cytochrome [Planctomycetales bacterium]